MKLFLSLAIGLMVHAGDPPIRVSLNHDYYRRGERAKVYVQADQDGYLVVLRADADGRVRVLFPLDPGDDNFVRGDREIEIRGRGDREAFSVDDAPGTGAVLAAISHDPLTFTSYVRGDHWDYRVLGERRVDDDPEAGLLDIVRQMAGDEHFDYDLARYNVETQSSRTYSSYYDPFYSTCFGCYSPGFGYNGYSFTLAVGRGYCDPFWYDPFDPFCYDGYRYGYGYGYGYGGFYPGGYYYPWWGGGYYSGRISDPQAASRRWATIHRPSGAPFVLKNASTNRGTWTPPLNPPAPRERPVVVGERTPPTDPGRPDGRALRPDERRRDPPPDRGRTADRPRSGQDNHPDHPDHPVAPPPARRDPPPARSDPPRERRGGGNDGGGRRDSPPPRAEPRHDPPPPPPPKQSGGGGERRDNGGGRRKP
jgi:uncharacterized protein DUF4384